MKTNWFVNNKLLTKFTGVVLTASVLYFTGAINVLWDFWRAVYPSMYSTSWVSDVSSFLYGHGYGSNGWGYWYGYWYGSNTNNAAWYYGYSQPTPISSSTATSANPTTSNITVDSANWIAQLENVNSEMVFSGSAKIDLWTSWLSNTSSSDTANGSTTIWTVSVTIAKKVALSFSSWTSLTLKSSDSNISEVQVILPQTTIYAPSNWDGKITPPTNVSTNSTVTSAISSASSLNSINVAIEVWSSDVMLLFADPVKIVLPTKWSAYYYVYSWTAYQISTQCTSATNSSNISWFGECYYEDWNTVIIRTKHFTSFVSASQSGSSSSSSSSWWWWWGSGSYNTVNSNVAKVIKETIKKNIEKAVIKWEVIEAFNTQVEKVIFKTAKFKKAMPIVNKIVASEVAKSQMISLVLDNSDISNNMVNDYLSFLDAMSSFEGWKMDKTELKVKLASFIKSYTVYKSELNKIVSITEKTINWTKITFITPKFNANSVTRVVTLITKKLENVLKEGKYDQSTMKNIVDSYNNFILSVKVFKETDAVLWKKLAKQFLSDLIGSLK